MPTVRDYITEILEPTILINTFIALGALGAALHYGKASLWVALLCVAGVALAQVAVNLVDDYVDFTTGLDNDTVKTKFSGGSGLVVSGRVKAGHVLAIGTLAAAAAACIGVYLAYSVTMAVLPWVAVGAVAIFLYAGYATKIPFLAEPFAMMSFVSVGIGSFIAISGNSPTWAMAAYGLVPAGMMGGIALLVNNVPDRAADRKHGRRSGVVMLWKPRRIAAYYAVCEAVAYLLVLAGVASGSLPLTLLATLITAPIALKVFNGISSYRSPAAYERYMGMNVVGAFAFMLIVAMAFAV